ncbi:hypothetical protein [Neotamlana laminarinivorans]|uniref:Uncharacterized protein n=1 Tax=Neotamlana laminarinivorans TaxID=2883124 RepID=A0A9X1I2B4_9FLAO|nr:hypothetical protein [Tamlana laminarinivorans]MCB4798982.1 hypothetical protein [Tamlana laminarinivorans]
MIKKFLLGVLASAFLFVSCEDDDTNVVSTNGGTLSGGPFTFYVDGTSDYVTDISLSNDIEGENTTYVITDDAGNILGLPATITDLEGVDFDGAGVGVCLIWHLAYEDGLSGLATGNTTADLSGNFDFSNSLTVNRLGGPDAGTLVGGPFTFTAGDGVVDNVSGITNSGTPNGTNFSYIITDEAGTILGLPGTLTDLEGVDFDGAGVGVCLIWYIRYEEGLTGLGAGQSASDLSGIFDLSNSLVVNREAYVNAGTLEGGPFTFTVGDGMADMVSGITNAEMTSGTNASYIITDEAGTILGLPGTITDVEGVDFDGAGAGVCLIWYIRYEDDLMGLAMGESASNLSGTFDLSNSITVNREPYTNAGTLEGGPFNFTAGDGMADYVSGISNSGTPAGTNATYIITDDAGNILGLPATLADLEGVNFDGAGVGVCLIWYLRYEDGITGLMMGENASNLSGYFDLSNSITVNRN